MRSRASICLRTTNPESTFATVRHRSRITKGSGSRAAGIAMAFKLIESAQARWKLEQSEGDFRRFASTIHQVACDV